MDRAAPSARLPANTVCAGDHAPWFQAPALSGSPAYTFDSVAGRHLLMLFFGSARVAASAEALQLIQQHRGLFDDVRASFFGVTIDPEDAERHRIAQQIPGVRFFLDYGRELSSLYGAISPAGYRQHWLIVDPGLRVVGIYPIEQGEIAMSFLLSAIASEPVDSCAPVLRVPNVLDPQICEHLVGLYKANGGKKSGFMREVDGKTVALMDARMKQRRDCGIEDDNLIAAIVARLKRRLNPSIERAFQFEPTRIERHIVACYAAGAGHFRPHRDNTTKGTAHRRFAVTINLNADDYEGGDLRFPEFGQRTYRATTGGAVVFSCSLLHEATPVTKGRRFAYLPFLYDEAGAQLRQANNHYLGEQVGKYDMGEAEATS